MRRILILFILVVLLALAYAANRLTANLHYVVPVDAGQVAYVATFDDFVSDWSLSTGRLKSFITDTGTLRIELNESGFPFSQAKPYFSDFDLRVQATAVAGSEANAYGVIFRLQNKDNSSLGDDDFYVFEVSADGYYRVMRSFNGKQKELSTWIPSPAVQQSIGAVNYLRVVAKGDQFQFFVNNQLVQLCIPDNPEGESTYPVTGECLGGKMLDTLTDSSIPNGQIGVVAQSLDEDGISVEFDNVVIYGPS